MRACMVAYTGYESDNRVRRYAESLARRGFHVDVFSLRGESQSKREAVKGVHVFRIQRRARTEKSKFVYLAKLLSFLLRSATILSREHLRERYDLIHVHSLPDFEVFAALVPKVTGSKIILDIHDLLPEFYASKFDISERSVTFRLLVAVERMSAAFADHVIASNHLWERRLEERSVSPTKCSTFLNYPDPDLFRRHGRSRNDNRFIILYPGSLSYHQGLDIAVQAFALIRDRIPFADFYIYGQGDQRDSLSCLIRGLKLQGRVFLKDPLPLQEIIAVIENADLGVVPKRNTSFGNEAFSTKVFEFMCMGVPMIVPDTDVDRFYFDSSVVEFFRANDVTSLADAMLRLINSPERRQSLISHAGTFIKKYTWPGNQGKYFELVDALVQKAK